MPSITHLLTRQDPSDPFAGMNFPDSDDRRPDIIIASVVGSVLAILTTLGRLAARRRTKAAIRADDWLIIAGLVMALGVVASTLVMVHFGLGRHINKVTNAPSMVQSVVASQILYSLSVIPIKLSILYLYHRLFPSPKLRTVAIAIGVVTILYSVAQAIVMGLQCVPLSALWDMQVAKTATCLNMSPFYTCMAIINVATDVLILTLPVPFIVNLSMQKARKIQLLAVFMTGGAVIAFGIVRAVNVGSASPMDQPWSDTPAAMWSVLEICVGVVSANLPCLRPLFFWLPSAIRGSTSGGKNNKASGYGANGSNGKRQSAAHGNAYEMGRRSRIIGANKSSGWESLDDSQALTGVSEKSSDGKRISVVESTAAASPTDSIADGHAGRILHGADGVRSPQGIMVQTTIETSYHNRG